jgi:hypothetical protein
MRFAYCRPTPYGFFQHGVAVFPRFHVDEVANDNSAEVAQAQLARGDLCGFQIGFENGVVEITTADEAACVYVHCGE